MKIVLMNYFPSEQDQNSPLMLSLKNGHTATFDELIKRGAYVNAKDSVDGWLRG
jgi:hypothetical protein